LTQVKSSIFVDWDRSVPQKVLKWGQGFAFIARSDLLC